MRAPRPAISLAAFVVLNAYLALEITQIGDPLSRLGIPSPWLILTSLGMLAIGLGITLGDLRIPTSLVFGGLAIFVWARSLSVLGALNPEASNAPFIQLLKDSITIIIVVTLGTWSGRRLSSTMQLVTLAAAAITGIAVVQQFAIGTAGDIFGLSVVRNDIDIGASTVRFQGPTSDPNFWARVLVALLPFAIASVAVHRRQWRAVYAGATMSILIGVFLTQSRAGFVAAGLTVGILLAIAGGRARRLLITAPIVVGLLLVNPATGPRLATLVDLTRASEEVTDLSIAYREAAQEGGLEMFRDHPTIGVGMGNFDSALLVYLRNGAAELPPDAEFGEIAPHNTYLQMAAESGVIGLMGYLALFMSAIVLAAISVIRAQRIPADSADAQRARWFTTAVLSSLCGWAVMSVSLHEAQLRTLFALIGLAGASAIVTKSFPRGQITPRLPWSMVRNDIIRGGLAVVVSAGAVLALPVESRSWTQTMTALLEVDEPAPDRALYLQNFVVHSVAWRRTIAEITTSGRANSQLVSSLGRDPDVVATARRFTSSIDYRFSGPTPAASEAAAAAIAVQVTEAVRLLGVPFSLRPLPATRPIEVTRVNPLLAALAILIPFVLVVLSWGSAAYRRLRFGRTYRRVRQSLEAQRLR